MYFQVFPGYFYCMHGPSLVELMGQDNSTADIMAHMFICTSAFMGHNIYRYCCVHKYMHIQYC